MESDAVIEDGMKTTKCHVVEGVCVLMPTLQGHMEGMDRLVQSATKVTINHHCSVQCQGVMDG